MRRSALALSIVAALTTVGAHSAETVECLPFIFDDHSAAERRNTIVDQRNRPIAPDRFAGRTVVVTMIPRDCDTACAMRLVDLDKVARALPGTLSGRVAIVAMDTGERSAVDLRKLATRWRLDAALWTLVGGRTEAARRRLDVAPPDAAEPSNVVVLFDAAGLLRQRYAGAPLDRERLAREIAVVDSLSRDASASACTVLSPIKLPS